MNIGIKELASMGNIISPNSIKQNNNNNIFDELYKSAIEMIDETNLLQKNAEQKTIDFALGRINNIHDVMIAQEKASIAIQYAVRIKNTAMDAYNEIMRMQI